MKLLISDTSVAENYVCTVLYGSFPINTGMQDDGTPLTRPLTVRVAAIIVSGPDRFFGRHSGKFLADGSGLIAVKNNRIKGFTEITLNTKGFGPTGLCWPDDNLDTSDNEVMIVIANGPGYTVHPTEGQKRFTITDNCGAPAATPDGVVSQLHGGSSCTCHRKLTPQRSATFQPGAGHHPQE